ncbi:ABC transporter ATP-binding protein [candidate division KSB1 bacterium]|nr:ABC transporter ATP-binding protein [candidate division KSB1 bacterium]
MTAITVDHLTKIYHLYDSPTARLKEALHPLRRKYHHDFYALNDISFSVEPGEVLGIIGKNGCGKSTLLKILAGVLTPTIGAVTVNGNVSALLELGGGFNPEFTGLENVYFSSAIMGYTREQVEKNLDNILAFADIGDFIQQPVKIYSSGMYVRLAFAVAINVDPDVLIVDEALSVGDIAFQAKCYKKFNEFRDAGKTILFVTHGLDAVLRYCHRAIVLHNGAKVAEGSPKAMVDAYKRILVNCYGFDDAEPVKSAVVDTLEKTDQPQWKSLFTLNPNILEYGNEAAEIIDYGIFDAHGSPMTTIISNDLSVVRMRVRFRQTIHEPIFAFAIKDLKGAELIGTNTFYEQIETGTFNPDDEVSVTFTQTMRLQVGAYTLSLGCTKHESDGLTVFHRLYDLLLFEVISAKTIFGLFDVNSSIDIRRIQ